MVSIDNGHLQGHVHLSGHTFADPSVASDDLGMDIDSEERREVSPTREATT